MGQVQRVFVRAIFSDLRRRARQVGIPDGKPGAVSVLQLAGSFLNLHPHPHVIVADGVFYEGHGGACTFQPLSPPSDADVLKLTHKVINKIGRLVAERHDSSAVGFADDANPSHAASQGEAIYAQLNVPQPRRGDDPFEHPTQRQTRCVCLEGYSVHANVSTAATDRAALERLCRYCLRPSFAPQRLSILPDGRIAYHLKRPFEGRTDLVLEPMALMKRLASLVPRPRVNLIRYYGVFSPGSPLRRRVAQSAARLAATPSCGHAHSSDVPLANVCVPEAQASAAVAEQVSASHKAKALPALPLAAPSQPDQPTYPPELGLSRWLMPSPEAIVITPADGPEDIEVRPRRLEWSQLILRVFKQDVMRCHCGGQREVIAFIDATQQPDVVEKILVHLGISATMPSIAPARAPPSEDPEFDFADDYGGDLDGHLSA
jgi:hypothetical protein